MMTTEGSGSGGRKSQLLRSKHTMCTILNNMKCVCICKSSGLITNPSPKKNIPLQTSFCFPTPTTAIAISGWDLSHLPEVVNV